MWCVWKDENKLKRGRGWPIYKKQNLFHQLTHASIRTWICLNILLLYFKWAIPGLYLFIFVFEIQFTESFYIVCRCLENLWYRKRPLYQPSHNHYPICFYFKQAIFNHNIHARGILSGSPILMHSKFSRQQEGFKHTAFWPHQELNM